MDNDFIIRSFNEIAETQRKAYSLSKFIYELELLTNPSSISGFIFDLNLSLEFLSFTEEKCYLYLQTGDKVLFNSEDLSIFLQVLGKVYFRRFHELDFIVKGEGEKTFTEICEIDLTDPVRIKGLVYMNEDNLVTSGERPLEEDLDALKFPARHLRKSCYTHMNRKKNLERSAKFI